MAATCESLNVIGLISGGKDSFFSLLHCLGNNHRVVALANLHPPKDPSPLGEQEDLNSFMYQTAGHNVIPLYSKALSLPLFRQEIWGSASIQSKDYHPASAGSTSRDPRGVVFSADADETESLVPLLQKIMNAHPTANAVSSGAILSSYQRTRIESVARRLGLIPLSYLWQYPSLPPELPGGLLDDMAAVGFDVRIVKVASGGLDEDLLWANLLDPAVRKKVGKGLSCFGGSVLGEGGEYETLVLDSIVPFWRTRIEIDVSKMSIRRGGGGEAWMSFADLSGIDLANISGTRARGDAWRDKLRIPQLWDAAFSQLVKNLEKFPSQKTASSDIRKAHAGPTTWEAALSVSQDLSTLRLNNITDPELGKTAGEQMSAINSRILELLRRYGIPSANNITFATILLRKIADFKEVNRMYEQLFTQPNPPARVTVACGEKVPARVQVMVSIVICLDKNVREGLHVQSRSYWAPANIGPYSQAISIPLYPDSLDPRLVYIAGQIPLVPASMEILQHEEHEGGNMPISDIQLFQRGACLSLQHLWRVGKVMNVSWWVDAIAFVVGDGDVQEKAMLAWRCWREVHQLSLWKADDADGGEDVNDGFDVWDRVHGRKGDSDDNSEDRHLLDFRRSLHKSSNDVPPFLAVQVDSLPRGCEVEWQSCGLAYSNFPTPTVQCPCFHFPITSNIVSSDSDLRFKISDVVHEQQRLGCSNATVYTPWPEIVGDVNAQIVPCKSVWGPDGAILAACIVIQYGV